jgi:hypothetical protein
MLDPKDEAVAKPHLTKRIDDLEQILAAIAVPLHHIDHRLAEIRDYLAILSKQTIIASSPINRDKYENQLR